MRTLFIGALAAGLLLAGTARTPAQEPKDIIAKAVKAHGGLEKINKYKGVQTKGKGKIEQMGGIEFTQESSVQVPDKIKELVHLTVMGQQVSITSVYNGKSGWINVNGNTMDMPEPVLDAVKDAVELMTMTRFAFTGNKDYELSLLGESKVNDKPALGIKVSRKGHKDVNLYFDKETGLLGKIEHRTKDPMTGQELNEERIILEYQDVDGVKSAKKILINRDGNKYMEAEMTEVKLLEKLDDSEFDKP